MDERAQDCLSAANGARMVSATLNMRGLSLPDQTRLSVRRHLDRLHVSLHRAVVSGSSRT
jgi:hypothetical protein